MYLLNICLCTYWTYIVEIVGGVCNFLGSVLPQQRFETVDQCYSSVTAQSFIQQTKDSTPSPQRRGPQSLINLFDHTVWLVGILVSQPEIELMPPAMEA